MNTLKIIATGFMLLYCVMAKAGEMQVGISYVPLISDKPDIHINYRPSDSHFQFGYKYQRWTDNFVDSFQVPITRSIQTRSGPILIYLSEIDTSGTLYYGMELLKYTAEEQTIGPGGGNGSISNNDLYFGAGITGHWGANLYNNWGGTFTTTLVYSSVHLPIREVLPREIPACPGEALICNYKLAYSISQLGLKKFQA